MKITSGVLISAQKVVIYGPEGIGKSTFASKFPNPLFIDTEGSTKNLNVKRFEKPSSWSMLERQIAYVKANPTACKTLIIDTFDWAEQLCMANLCAAHNKNGIEDFGYGNGYVYAREAVSKFLLSLDDLIGLGIHIVLTAHAQMRKFEQPEEIGAYDRWELKLGKKTSSQTAPLVKEWADMVLFANYETFAMQTDKEGKKFKATGGNRVMYTSYHPCWDAKNRHNLPEKLPFDFANIAHCLPENVSDNKAIKAIAEAPAPEEKPVANLEGFTEIIGAETAEYSLSERIPKALRDLMQEEKVTEAEIQLVVSQKGTFPAGMPIWDYEMEYIEGVLIGAWPQVLEKVKDNRELPF